MSSIDVFNHFKGFFAVNWCHLLFIFWEIMYWFIDFDSFEELFLIILKARIDLVFLIMLKVYMNCFQHLKGTY